MLPAGDIAEFVGGFVAAEGCFTRTKNRFRFAVALGAVDGQMCEVIAQVLGAGRVHHYARRQAHFDDTSVLAVQSIPELVDKVVPLMDAFLPSSKKREQYMTWRRELLDHWENGARRRRPCTVDGCDTLQRGKGLCRKHYYQRYGM